MMFLMYHNAFILTAFSFAVYCSCQQSSLYRVQVNNLKSVTVFSQSQIAEIIRNYSINLKTLFLDREFVGKSQIFDLILQELPRSLDEKSLRVFLGEETTIGNVVVVSVKTVYVNSGGNKIYHPNYYKFLNDLELKLSIHRNTLAIYTVDKSRYQTRLKSWDTYVHQLIDTQHNTDASGAKINAILPVHAFIGLMNSYEIEVSALQSNSTQLDFHINELNAEIDTLEKRKSQLKSTGIFNLEPEDCIGKEQSETNCQVQLISQPKEELELHLQIFIEFDQKLSSSLNNSNDELNIFVSYFISPSTWSPEYDVNIISSRPSPSQRQLPQINIDDRRFECVLDIGYFAVVSQSTGEDWINGNITLSTAQPKDYIPLPSRPASQGVYFNNNNQQQEDSGSGMHHRGRRGHMSNNIMMAKSMAAQPEFAYGSAQDKVGGATRQSDFGSTVESLGNLGANYVFKLSHKINITSRASSGTVNPLEGHTRDENFFLQDQTLIERNNPQHNNMVTKVVEGRQRLSIQSLKLLCHVYTFAVPSLNNGAYLQMLSKYSSASSIPLLQSTQNARIFIDGAFTGISDMPQSLPGSTIRLNLGQDKNIQISSHAVLPQHTGLEEDKSTWFVTDKRKFRLKTMESLIKATSNYRKYSSDSESSGSKTLVILSENIPKSTESEVNIKLLNPLPADILPLSNLQTSKTGTASAGDGVIVSDEMLIDLILENEKSQKSSFQNVKVFISPSTNNIFWVKWLEPGEEFKVSFKYQMSWPDEKQIFVN